MNATIEIDLAESKGDVEIARDVFREYEAAIGVDLCFQSFEKELAELPGLYAPPKGRLYLLRIDGEVEGGQDARCLPAVDRIPVLRDRRLHGRG